MLTLTLFQQLLQCKVVDAAMLLLVRTGLGLLHMSLIAQESGYSQIEATVLSAC